MKIKLIFSAVALLLISNAHAQTFVRAWNNITSYEPSVIDMGDQTFYVGPESSRLTYNGNSLYRRYLKSLTSGTSYTAKLYYKFEDNKIAINGWFRDSCDNLIYFNPHITIMDTSFNIMNQVYYEFNLHYCEYFARKFDVSMHKNIILSGRATDLSNWPSGSFKRNAFAMAVDTTLTNIIFAKYFSVKGMSMFAKQLPDKSYIVNVNDDSLPTKMGAVLIKLDSAGNILWAKSYLRPLGILIDAVVNDDGSLICIGFDDRTWPVSPPLPLNISAKLIIMKIDTSGAVIWAKAFDDVYPFKFTISHNYEYCGLKIIKLFDGNYMVGANKITNTTVNKDVGGHGMLMKINQNGDTIYTRGYGLRKRVGGIRGFGQLEDSTFYMVGGYAGWGNWGQGALFYKTDTLANVPCGGDIYDPISITPFFTTDSLITVTSIDGAIAHISNLADTIAPGLPLVDDCLTIGSPEVQIFSQSRIYPNPTRGKVTIKTPTPYIIPDHVTVYDARGIIVLQKQIKTEKDLQLDLSKYGKGIYLVKVSEGEKESSSKVVVE